MTPHPTPLDTVARTARPWGTFDRFTHNEACTVKIITVDPGQRLSLQRHLHRDEMWQVLDGLVDVVIDGHTTVVGCGGRVWVPRTTTHRIGNASATPARVLEIAFGEFDENDIERLDDDYRRP